MSQTRRLAAILATDVAGYPRLLRADVTEELLAEAHEKPDNAAITSMFFIGFLLLLILEGLL